MNYDDAVFSPDQAYRYALSRRILDPLDSTPSERRLLAVMLNPSKADARTNDLTITKCMGFARKWGYGVLRVVNFYALVSTDPKALLTHPDPVGPANDSHLDSQVRWADDVWLAWGDNKIFKTESGQKRLQFVNWLIKDAAMSRRIQRFHLGLTKSGQPRHPSRLPYDTRRVEVL